MRYFILTKTPEEPAGAMYATVGEDHETVVQIFLDEDAATSYNVYLEALDSGLHVVELEDIDMIARICDVKGYAYTLIVRDHVVVPRVETQKYEILNAFKSDSI